MIFRPVGTDGYQCQCKQRQRQQQRDSYRLLPYPRCRREHSQSHLGRGYGHHREQGTGRSDHGKSRRESEHRNLAGEGNL